MYLYLCVLAFDIVSNAWTPCASAHVRTRYKVLHNEKTMKVILDFRERASEKEVMMVATAPASVIANHS